MKSKLQNSKKLSPSSIKMATAPLPPKYSSSHPGTWNSHALPRTEPHLSWTPRHDQLGRCGRQWYNRFPWISVLDGQVQSVLLIEKWKILILRKSLSKLSRCSIEMETASFQLPSWDTLWQTWEKSWLTNRLMRWFEKLTSMEMDISTTKSSSEWWWLDDSKYLCWFNSFLTYSIHYK